jgi:hypothetical protein
MVDSLLLRNARAQAFIDTCGQLAKIEFYNGAIPENGDVPAGTLLATLTATAGIGTLVSGGVLISSSGFAQTQSSHVNGTPTFIRFKTSVGSFVRDVQIGSGGVTFTGEIKTGTKILINSLIFQEP